MNGLPSMGLLETSSPTSSKKRTGLDFFDSDIIIVLSQLSMDLADTSSSCSKMYVCKGRQDKGHAEREGTQGAENR